MSRKIKGEQKKFLGETLNQYDKALNEGINQLDKKNREQNHKISSLVNSFDNEYLEKDVEGNMTTLENSKDGMVIINEIQGGTEVNYCKDGEKELILNGDIDTQGKSFVTITEGVDGGLVDVSLEGNTEINLSSTKDPVLVTREFDDINCNTGKLQYTIDDVTTINDEPGKVDIDRIVGDTMVNHAVNGSEELILNAHINESGDNNITLNGVTSDGGKVDVALEGNTLVNVSKTKDSTGISKAYTVENSGNHIALQGDTDGSCKPVITGNSLVNLIDIKGNENISGNTVYSKVTDTEFIFDWSKGQAYNNWIQVRNNVDLIQEGKTYTIIINILENNPTLDGAEVNGELLLNTWFNGFNIVTQYIPYGTTGLYKYTFSAVRNSTQTRNMIGIRVNSKADNVPGSAILMNGGKLRISRDISVLEGDYTNKPIPDYFEGLQSSFEDNLVTQEMVNSGGEVADNLGKYRVDYKSTREDGTVGSTKTLYLNSPLLEGDTIEEKDGGIYHVHRSELVAYTEGDEASLITDRVHTLHQLASPRYELIEQSNLVIPSYVKGHLDFDTAVPVEKVEFLPFTEELTYLYANTQYTIQFISDKAITADITLGGTKLLAQSIVAGVNRVTITTPATLVDNKLILDGVGANISEVVVTDTDGEFKYFEGMKSVGECEELEVRSNSKNLINTIGSIQECFIKKGTQVTVSYDSCSVTNKPRIEYYSKDMKQIDWWSVYRENTEKTRTYHTFTIKDEDCYFIKFVSNGNSDINNVMLCIGTSIDYIPHQSNKQQLTHEPLRAVGDVKDRYVLIDNKWYIERNTIEERVLDIWNWVKSTGAEDFYWCAHNSFKFDGNQINVLCDKLKSVTTVQANEENFFTNNCDYIAIGQASGQSPNVGSMCIDLNPNILVNKTLEGFKEYIRNNEINIIYPLQTPQYEPLDYNPFEVYSDITHISVNSSIPCNIAIKNHGYNLVALKENTQYTLYVNKNTTNALTYRLGDYVEINSQSKFTFTTPSTLTDKTLRIDGKGAKVKDLMLIEGTPTNDSVGYFDGLKSSYECEQVTDENDENYGKYKVDVKVVGKNLFDINKLYKGYTISTEGSLVTTTNSMLATIKLDVSNLQGYTLVKSGGNRGYYRIEDNKNNLITYGNSITITIPTGSNILYWYVSTNKDDSIQIEQGDTATEYEPYFESKQTIYLNSPLLKGDEIVWKDNKIQHYHKMNTVVLDGSDDENIIIGKDMDATYINTIQFFIKDAISGKAICECICDKFNYKFVNSDNEHYYTYDVDVIIFMAKSKLQTKDVTGFRQWLQQNPITVVYPLATPYYEEISDYPLKLNVIANSSLSTESTIQVTNISFNVYEETLPYLYSNTKYYITFNADVDRNNIVIDLGGNHVVFDCKVGFNKVEITTPSDTTNLLTFSGTGVNIDHVKVTQQDIDEYFEGMKSVGECEELEITSANSDNTLLNVQQLTHEPLRSVGEVKDRYVMIDGKWFIERKCNEVIMNSLQELNDIIILDILTTNNVTTSRVYVSYSNATTLFPNISRNSETKDIICDKLRYKKVVTPMQIENQIAIGKTNTGISFRLKGSTIEECENWLNNNPLKIAYVLASPQYEPIDYNPFDTYSDVTHISTNSLIPTNVVVKNHGYNCIIKPSTTYTVALNKPNGTISAKLGGSAKVDSTNSVFTITTPSTLNDNVLRLSGSGKVKDIMILEGDKTVNTPSYFEGIESVFEQEYDIEKDKYRVTARVEGNGKESSIIFYINEPLRGVDTVKDKVFIQDGKVVVKRNCGSYTFDGNEGWIIEDLRNNTLSCRWLDSKHVLNLCSQLLHCNTLPVTEVYNKDNEGIDIHSHLVMHSRVHISRLQTQDVAGFIQWLQQNPTTIVYELAEPVYELVDCDLSKLVLENYENSSLIFESNIPVSANIRYSGEVPVVTQAKSLSSQVDNTTLDINENIIPYMCDIDYRIVELQLMNGDTQGEGIELLGIGDIEILGNENVLFNNREDKKHNFSYDMLKRDILSQRYSKEEYQYRLDRYLLANKISDEEYKELEGLLNNGE